MHTKDLLTKQSILVPTNLLLNLVPCLHQFSESYWHHIWCKIKFLAYELVPELCLLTTLFGTNLLSNTSVKNHPIQCKKCTIMVQIRCKFITYFDWVDMMNTPNLNWNKFLVFLTLS